MVGPLQAVRVGPWEGVRTIPAYAEIDQRFEPAEACADCGNWQRPDKGVCDLCLGENLASRERRIYGWLGIQRHLDKREFGIDFLRNGRKILQWDKQLFNWQNPHDPLGAVDTEYPIELANQGGRIIGEIHLDHVPVTYQKDAFEYSDRSWRAAVDFLRGDGPLQPEKAKRAGYPENTSPLGRLFKGYRRNAAGARCLIPGDGTGPIHDDTRRWAQRFHAEDPDFQTDQRWWDAVAYHDEQGKRTKLEKAQRGAASQPDEAAVLEALGADPVDTTGDATGPDKRGDAKPAAPVKETTQDRLARYLADSTVIPDLTRDFGLPRLGNLRVETRGTTTLGLRDDSDQPTPILLIQGAGGTATAFVDPNHEVFTKLGVEVAELLLVEVAALLKIRAESDLTHSQMVASLRAACLPDSALDIDVVSVQARELMADVRRLMAAKIEQDVGRAFQYLTPDELTATENEMIANGQVALTVDLGKSSDFLLYVPPLFTVKLLEAWPEALMDGQVFAGPYSSVSSPSARRLSLARVAGYLNDIATLLSFRADPGPLQLQRTRLSIKLLADELAAEA